MDTILVNPYSRYKENQVVTNSPEKLLILLYNGAIKCLKLSRAGLEENNLGKVNNNLLKAQSIISELMISLDFSQEQIAQPLYSLYRYMEEQLIQANLHKDLDMIMDVEVMLVELRDTWESAAKGLQSSKHGTA